MGASYRQQSGRGVADNYRNQPWLYRTHRRAAGGKIDTPQSKDPNHQDDGRRWLGHHPEMRFDAVVANTSFHFRANATNLLSLEYLKLVKQHLNPGGIFFYNTTGSQRVQRTACTVFPHGARFTNHMVVSETPIDWNFSRWRNVLKSYTVDGKTVFDPNSAADQSHVDSLMRDYRPGGSMVLECPELISATTDSALITDDNMGTEWRYPLNLD